MTAGRSSISRCIKIRIRISSGKSSKDTIRGLVSEEGEGAAAVEEEEERMDVLVGLGCILEGGGRSVEAFSAVRRLSVPCSRRAMLSGMRRWWRRARVDGGGEACGGGGGQVGEVEGFEGMEGLPFF